MCGVHALGINVCVYKGGYLNRHFMLSSFSKKKKHRCNYDTCNPARDISYLDD